MTQSPGSAPDNVPWPEYAKARFGKRFMAACVDYLLVPLVGLGFFVTAHILSRFLGLAALSAAGLVCLAYFLVKDGLVDGSSVGKYLSGLMVVNLKTDAPCSVKLSLLRAVPIFVPPAGVAECVLVVFNRKGRRIGDMLAGTMVVSRVDYLGRKYAGGREG